MMENEQIVDKIIKKIENVDEEKENLIDKLKVDQNELANLINKRNSKMLIYLFLVLLSSLVLIPLDSFIISLVTLILGGGLGVVLKNLLKLKEKAYELKNIDLLKKIEELKEEKTDLKKELSKYIEKSNEESVLDIIDKRLYEIKLEKGELKKLRNLMDEEASYIDIKDVYLVQINNLKYIARLESPAKMLHRFVDVFNYVEVWSHVGCYFDDAVRRYDKCCDEPLFYKKIQEAEPTLLAYPDNLVPDYVLKQVFYHQNNVDLDSPILKKEKN